MLLASFYFSLASYQCVRFNLILKTNKNKLESSCLCEGIGDQIKPKSLFESVRFFQMWTVLWEIGRSFLLNRYGPFSFRRFNFVHFHRSFNKIYLYRPVYPSMAVHFDPEPSNSGLTRTLDLKTIWVTSKRIAKFTFFYLIPRGYELFYHFRVANDPPCPSQQSTNQNFLFHATAESSLLISGFFAGFWIWNSKTFEQFRRKKYMKYSPKAWV